MLPTESEPRLVFVHRIRLGQPEILPGTGMAGLTADQIRQAREAGEQWCPLSCAVLPYVIYVLIIDSVLWGGF